MKEYDKEWHRQYYLTHREDYLRRTREWKERNPERVKIHLMASGTKQYIKRTRFANFDRRMRLLKLLGNKCIKCQIDDYRCLQFDHLNGGGYEDRKRFRNNSNLMIIYYLEHPEEAKEKLQLLCANHNWIKRYEENELPGII